jgi:hypothetical protein
MSHGLLLGMTESGKTTLGKKLSHSLGGQGRRVLLLDEMNDPGWYADFRTADPETFLKVFWANQSCFAFIDEAGDAVGRYDDAMRETATKGRHFGHSCFYLSQRGAQLNTTVRAQCRHLWLFTSAADDCKILCKEFNCPELIQAAALPAGSYLHKTKHGALDRGVLFTPKGIT